jgi:hypothetical protein
MNDLIHPIIAYYPAITATDGIIIRQLLRLWARPKNGETPSIIQLLLIQNTGIDDYYFFKVQVQLHRSCAHIPPPIFFVLVHKIH